MKKNKRILFVPVFLIVILLVTYFCHFFYVKKEFECEIHFLVAKVVTTMSLKSELYDKAGSNLSLNSFTFFKSHKINVGDSIVKNSNSATLYIYRKDLNNNYQIYLKVQQK